MREATIQAEDGRATLNLHRKFVGGDRGRMVGAEILHVDKEPWLQGSLPLCARMKHPGRQKPGVCGWDDRT